MSKSPRALVRLLSLAGVARRGRDAPFCSGCPEGPYGDTQAPVRHVSIRLLLHPSSVVLPIGPRRLGACARTYARTCVVPPDPAPLYSLGSREAST